MSRAKIPIQPLHRLEPRQLADFFALLIEKARGSTRDGKPYFQCKFRDAKRTVAYMVWADGPLFADCDAHWQTGRVYKIRGTYTEHERYGPQIEVAQIREATADDKADGYDESQFFERSRFDSAAMFVELRTLAETEIADVPLRTLTLAILDAHAEVLKKLPASDRRFYPFPGGWLEHSLNVTRNSLWLVERYRAHYAELTPPLNRDLVAAGAVLHDIGRAAELVPGELGLPAEPTVAGRLLGHLLLGRDLIRSAAAAVPDLNPELLQLLEHVVLSHLELPSWGSARLPAIPEVLILHHADDLDAKLEMYVRCLQRDASDGPFTDRDPILGKPLFKGRSV